MFTKCPGQDWRDVTVGYYQCPKCSSEVEIFSFDVGVRCRRCGEMVLPTKLPSCIEWCESARACLGETKWKEWQERKRREADDNKD
jgi:DNA-directed RNA polymerase subunit RPC12/RpoP